MLGTRNHDCFWLTPSRQQSIFTPWYDLVKSLFPLNVVSPLIFHLKILWKGGLQRKDSWFLFFEGVSLHYISGPIRTSYYCFFVQVSRAQFLKRKMLQMIS